MERKSLISDTNIETIKKVRKAFLKVAVWILIAELVFGAVLILSQSWNISIGKIQGSFLIVALVLFVSVNNFIRMEKGDRVVQGFAIAGFISNIIWAFFALLLMWEIVPFYWYEEVRRTRGGYPVFENYSGSYMDVMHMTFWSMVMAISAYAAAASFWLSNVLSIKETIKLVKPLKITAVVCVCYCWIFGTITTLAESEYEDIERLSQLAGLAGLAFVITSLAALIISKTNKNKVAEAEANGNAVKPVTKSDAELRAEIEEKVRREMIEKEVRAKVEAEMAAKKDDVMEEPKPSDDAVKEFESLDNTVEEPKISDDMTEEPKDSE